MVRPPSPDSSSSGTSAPDVHPIEPYVGAIAPTLNWLRAGVLGANDAIASTAGNVAGVAVQPAQLSPIRSAGIAGLSARAVSITLGEHVSVSTQRDTEAALLGKERRELKDQPKGELAELTALHEGEDLSQDTARKVAEELTDHDAFTTHVDTELGIGPKGLTNPWQGAFSAAISLLPAHPRPLVAILLPPIQLRIPVTVVSVLGTLAITGFVSARLGDAHVLPAQLRNVVDGGLALAIAFAIRHLVGATVS